MTPLLVNVGVTVIVAVNGIIPGLIAVNEGISPVPLAARPMEGWVLTQLKIVVPPVLFVVNTVACVGVP